MVVAVIGRKLLKLLKFFVLGVIRVLVPDILGLNAP